MVAKNSDENGLVHTWHVDVNSSKKSLELTMLNTLVQRCEGASIKENVVYLLFSAEGFQDEFLDYAEEHGIILVDC